MIAREVSEVKKTRAEGGQRFQSRKTHTDCLVFISCAAPLDPIRLVEGAVSDLIQTKTPTTQSVIYTYYGPRADVKSVKTSEPINTSLCYNISSEPRKRRSPLSQTAHTSIWPTRERANT